MSAGVVLWDFDGTLAWRPGLWGACVLEVLDEREQGHTGTLDQIRADLSDGFPWHRPEQAHPELSEPDAWWAAIAPLLSGAIAGAGVTGQGRADQLAGAVRERFIDATRVWLVFDDTRPALEATAAGWRNAILSNHVPGLDELVTALGLGDLIEDVFSSATIGYEKPNPEAFRYALRRCGNPARSWMVGDNPVADVAGARAVGIPAILIRSSNTGGRQRATSRDGPGDVANVADVADAAAAARVIVAATNTLLTS